MKVDLFIFLFGCKILVTCSRHMRTYLAFKTYQPPFGQFVGEERNLMIHEENRYFISNVNCSYFTFRQMQ